MWYFLSFKIEDMIEKFNYGTNDRIEPIVLMADEGWLLYPYDRTSPRPGSHGFDPNFRSMNGIYPPIPYTHIPHLSCNRH